MPIAYCVWKMENSSCSPTRVSLRKTAFFPFFSFFFFVVFGGRPERDSPGPRCRPVRTHSRVRCGANCASTCSRSSDRTAAQSRSRRIAPKSTTCLQFEAPVSTTRHTATPLRTDGSKAHDGEAPLQRRASAAATAAARHFVFRKKKNKSTLFGFLLSPDSQAVFTTRRATSSSCG